MFSGLRSRVFGRWRRVPGQRTPAAAIATGPAMAPRRSSAIAHPIELLPLLFGQDLSDLFTGFTGDLSDLASGPLEDLPNRNPLIFVQTQ